MPDRRGESTHRSRSSGNGTHGPRGSSGSNGRAGAHGGNGRAEGAAVPNDGDNGDAAISPSSAAGRLSSEELEWFRAQLLEKRRELVGDVTTMEDEALRKTRSESTGDLSLMPIHMADIGTDNYEQEFTLGLIANEREMLKEIDEALDRIASGTYGVCQATQKPISKARLKIKPWARYCLEYKRSQEQSRRR